jgi:hypothetical protein
MVLEQEHDAIAALFELLFKQGGFSYSLHGDKPVSISDYSVSGPTATEMLCYCRIDQYVRLFFEVDAPPATLLKKWWNTWLKHQLCFISPDYVIFLKKYARQERIFFINKRAVREIFRVHRALFADYLGVQSCEQLIALLLDGEQESSQAYATTKMVGWIRREIAWPPPP